jgi:hypothetical protein
MSMMLRIERFKGRIRLSGELRIAHLEQVKNETEGCESPVVMDLQEVDLIDLEGVRFSMHVRRRVLQSFTVRLTSGNGCCGSESE